jgi:RNA polymerase sigma-70 factor (ECF subfamily)
VAAGDSAAVEECLQKYGGLVWSLARRFCANHADAEDAVQEIFIEVWRTAGRFDPGVGSEGTYITMIARRRLIDRYRRDTRKPNITSIQEDAVGAGPRHVDQTEISEEAARARRSMQKLRPEERQVLELSINGGLSQSQIAEATNLPLGTVKTHARRGLIRLRELLSANPAGSVMGERP